VSMTKKQLEAQLLGALENLRRAERALGEVSLNLDSTYVQPFSDRLNVPTSEAASSAVKRAQSEWAKKITEPPPGKPSPEIDKYIRGVDGLGWSSADASDLSSPHPYIRDSFSWCGAFVSWCYGLHTTRTMRKKTFPSCYRMYRDWAGSSRSRGVGDIKQGDILTVWTTTTKSIRSKYHYGQHIALVITPPDDEGYVTTIEGNARGEGPKGSTFEGVITRKRYIQNIAYVYRLLSEDIVC